MSLGRARNSCRIAADIWRTSQLLETECLPLRVRKQAVRAQKLLVRLPPFVGSHGQTSSEENAFAVAECPHPSQMPQLLVKFFFVH